MVEAEDVQALLATLPLNANEFARINVVAVLWRILARVAATRNGGDAARAIIFETA